MGDIGKPERHHTFEPMPESEPIKEPAAPSVVPATPAPVREPEKVPA